MLPTGYAQQMKEKAQGAKSSLANKEYSKFSETIKDNISAMANCGASSFDVVFKYEENEQRAKAMLEAAGFEIAKQSKVNSGYGIVIKW